MAADSRQLRIDAREQAIGNHRAALHPGQRHNRSITKPLADGAGHTFAPAAETWARTTVRSNICAGCAVSLNAAGASKKTSKVPDWLKRQNRFQTLFQWPNFSGRARQV
ncbi:MAG: hypothetical protein WA177_23775, partial [Xanthobacteraceae bacterium]